MLKRLIYRLIVGLMTFVISLSLTSIWNLLSIESKSLVSQSNENLVSDSSLDLPIELFILDAHPRLYLGKRVRLRGLMYATDWQTLNEGLIDKLTMDSSIKEKAKLTIKLGGSEESTYASLGENSCTSDMHDVEVIGYLEPKVEKDSSCHYYHISDAHIVEVRHDYCF